MDFRHPALGERVVVCGMDNSARQGGNLTVYLLDRAVQFYERGFSFFSR